jgi:hypothetical protein
VILENERFKAATSIAVPGHAKAETEAAQAKQELIFNLMMKCKEFDSAGFLALQIDERLPFPRKDANHSQVRRVVSESSKKKRRHKHI